MANDPICLIVRADDIGCAHAANVACLKTFAEGVCRSVEIMPCCSWFPEACQMLNERPDFDVGVHCMLTSEWTGVKWAPLTRAPSLVGPDGYFPRTFYRGKLPPDEPIFFDLDWKLEEVEAELRAQIERTLQRLPHASHVSFHMGGGRNDERIGALYGKLTDEYGLRVDLEANGFERLRIYEGGKPPSTDKQARLKGFVDALERLGPGKWLTVEHPGLDTPEMRAMGHPGYEDVAPDRQSVTDCWTSPEAKEVVERRGIRLVSYKDVKEGKV